MKMLMTTTTISFPSILLVCVDDRWVIEMAKRGNERRNGVGNRNVTDTTEGGYNHVDYTLII